MFNITRLYISMLVIQCIVTTGMTVIHFANLFGTDYYMVITAIVLIIFKVHVSVGSLLIKTYYLQQSDVYINKGNLYCSLINLYNFILIISWLYLKGGI